MSIYLESIFTKIFITFVTIGLGCLSVTNAGAEAEGSQFLQLGAECSANPIIVTKDQGTPAPSICDPTLPLECLNSRCQCKPGFTSDRNETNCLEIGRNGLESTCLKNIQCWKSLLGRLSECHQGTGKCRCYESETLPIVYHQGRCYYGESIGEFCQIDGLCSRTTQNAICSSGVCTCGHGFVPSWDKYKCLPIADSGLNSTCEENVQCEKSQLGTLSECNQERMQCQCYSIQGIPTVFSNGRCYFGAGLGDVCQVSAQCLATTEHAICSSDGKCVCEEEEGFIPNFNETLCLPIISSDGGTSECQENIQCSRVLGHFARCNLEKGKCECVSPEEGSSEVQNSTTMVIVGAKCLSARGRGQSCTFNRQCSTLTQGSVCEKGICECPEVSHVVSNDGRKCLEIVKDGWGSPCIEDSQCQSSILGPLSQCEPNSRKCDCSSVLPVIYYEKRCYFQRQVGSSCESDPECRAALGPMGKCFEGRCSCENGTLAPMDHLCQPIVGESGSGSRGILQLLDGAMWIMTIICIIY